MHSHTSFSLALWSLLVFLFPLCTEALADIRVANIFGDNMVIQRQSAVPIWGWSKPGDNITVKAKGQTVSALAGADGKWSVRLEPIAVGDPFNILITGSESKIEIKNVLAGEVWICGGQSNMAWTVARSGNPAEEIAKAKFPLIRQVKIANKFNENPQHDVENSGWKLCSPETAGEFTAVGYYFARKLHRETGLPIGLINCNWGGTIVEAWTSSESLSSHPDFTNRIEAINNQSGNLDEAKKQFVSDLREWKEQLQKEIQSEDQNRQPDFDDSSWSKIQVPGQWEQQGHPNFDGLAWFRKQIAIPKDWIGKELKLQLGQIDDVDRTFVNGELVGQTNRWNKNRTYKVPANVNSREQLVVAVQVHDLHGGGGFVPTKQGLNVQINSDSKINLKGSWNFKIQRNQNELPAEPRSPGFNGPNHPTALFNGMLRPVIPYAIRGAIWYQGESNASRAQQYRSLFPLLIQDWRKQWNQELPFYWVQLANFRKTVEQPGSSDWAELREAQSMALKLPSTGEAIIIDIGEANDIHPKNKQDVGKRLAYIALNKHYGIAARYSGPRFKNYLVEGNRIRLRFDFAEGLKSADGNALSQFAIAGWDQKFVWANADIEGNEVVVSSDQVAEPVAVRYAWADNPEGCNLTNVSDLPASPFRTDNWPGSTDGKK